jgi:hypothetical protein
VHPHELRRVELFFEVVHGIANEFGTLTEMYSRIIIGSLDPIDFFERDKVYRSRLTDQEPG